MIGLPTYVNDEDVGSKYNFFPVVPWLFLSKIKCFEQYVPNTVINSCFKSKFVKNECSLRVPIQQYRRYVQASFTHWFHAGRRTAASRVAEEVEAMMPNLETKQKNMNHA